MNNAERKQIASEYYDKHITDEILSLNPSWRNKKNFISWAFRKIKSQWINLEVIDTNWLAYYHNLRVVNLSEPIKKTKKKKSDNCLI